jgi:hypothetical protein
MLAPYHSISHHHFRHWLARIFLDARLAVSSMRFDRVSGFLA